MRNTHLVPVLALVFAAPMATADQVLLHPGESIQAAINAASDGDEIILAAGTYTQWLSFEGKAVTVRSESGPEMTTINAAGLGECVVLFDAAEGSASRLEGLTLTGGEGHDGPFGVRSGGAMFIGFGANPTVVDCRLVGNTASYGAAIYGEGGAGGLFEACIIEANTGLDAIRYGDEDTPVQSTPVFRDCEIRANVVTDGYGLWLVSCDATFVDCVIADHNSTAVLLRRRCGTTFDRCVFSGNNSAGVGGAIWTAGQSSELCNPVFTNCLFEGNTAVYGGGAVLAQAGTAGEVIAFTNCTFVSNRCSDPHSTQGGAIYVNNGMSLELNNCLFWANSVAGPGLPLDHQIFSSYWPFVTIEYSLLPVAVEGVGNITGNPGFMDFAAGDYRLLAGSPAIDAGSNLVDTSPAVAGDQTIPVADFDGLPRFIDDPETSDTGIGDAPIVDMGAFEYQGPPPCDADLNGDDELNFFDVQLFLGLFASGDLAVDFNDDGVLNFFDVQLFLSLFAAGCP